MKKLGKHFLKLEKKQEMRDEDRVLSDKASFFIKEAYKALRTNLIFSLPSEDKKVILVTSSGMSEGKTTSCLNTAISFAQTGAKVCVVDCDMRKPNMARLCETKGSPGLSNVLAHINEMDEVIRKSKYNNLDFIFSGDIPPNPAELLVSGGMETLVNTLAERYDYVFIDTPPINVVTDASLLAGLASGVVLVVNQQKTSKTEVAKAVSQLEFVHAKILGVLLNSVKTDSGATKYRRYGRYGKYGYGRYGYGHYYEYTSSTGAKKK